MYKLNIKNNTMSFDQMKREYNSKFKFQNKFKFNADKYEKLLDQTEYTKAKEIFIKFSENKLHVLATYSYLFKLIGIFVIPFLIFTTINIIIIMLIMLIFILFSVILNKDYKYHSFIYYIEIQSLDYLLSEKYNQVFSTDLSDIGNKYIESL